VAHPVLGPSGDLVEFVGSIIDVTERKWAEEERERLLQTQAYLAHFNRVTTMGPLLCPAVESTARTRDMITRREMIAALRNTFCK
jgi:hypothetical protein